MKHDILSLGGVMHKAQEIYWKLYQIDIESKITLSSLALSIFRLKYYDVSNFPIHIPNKNEDTFIRRAYYGGHTDTYKPYSEFKEKHASSWTPTKILCARQISLRNWWCVFPLNPPRFYHVRKINLQFSIPKCTDSPKLNTCMLLHAKTHTKESNSGQFTSRACTYCWISTFTEIHEIYKTILLTQKPK